MHNIEKILKAITYQVFDFIDKNRNEILKDYEGYFNTFCRFLDSCFLELTDYSFLLADRLENLPKDVIKEVKNRFPNIKDDSWIGLILFEIEDNFFMLVVLGYFTSILKELNRKQYFCLLYTSPSPRD